jgi:8-oxo-dGTP pyrophosphatase MutT (NUDIX family)
MGDIDISQKDPYFIAVKVFLERGTQFLILKDKFGAWDLPGGRIKKFEFETPLSGILERKLREELGTGFTYQVEAMPSVLMRHERVEASPGNPTVHIFGLGYSADLISGEPELSDAHTEMLWVEIATFTPEDYFTGGWLMGVKEYLSLKKVS